MAVLGNKTDEAVANGMETLNQSLAIIIQKATTGVESGINFLSDQIPDVIHQLLMWKMAESIFLVVCSILVIFLWGYGLKKASEYDAYDSWGVPVAAIGGCASIGAMIIFFTYSLKVLEIWIAPKIYLIEYVPNSLESLQQLLTLFNFQTLCIGFNINIVMATILIHYTINTLILLNWFGQPNHCTNKCNENS